MRCYDIIISMILHTAFRNYLTSKCQGWFWRRGGDEPAAVPAAAPAPGAGGVEAVLDHVCTWYNQLSQQVFVADREMQMQE